MFLFYFLIFSQWVKYNHFYTESGWLISRQKEKIFLEVCILGNCLLWDSKIHSFLLVNVVASSISFQPVWYLYTPLKKLQITLGRDLSCYNNRKRNYGNSSLFFALMVSWKKCPNSIISQQLICEPVLILHLSEISFKIYKAAESKVGVRLAIQSSVSKIPTDNSLSPYQLHPF